MRKRKYSEKWFNNLTLDEQVALFRHWRIISIDSRKHWCLNDIKETPGMIKLMLDELGANIRLGTDIRGDHTQRTLNLG